jgi:hypothetical protein
MLPGGGVPESMCVLCTAVKVYHLTLYGRAHDCQAKGRRFKSRHRRYFNLQPYLLAFVGFVGTCGGILGKEWNWGVIPGKQMKINPSLTVLGPISQLWLQNGW